MARESIRVATADPSVPTAEVATDLVSGINYTVVKLDLGGDGSSTPVTTTVPVSGTVTVNAGTNASTAALALESGGNLAAQTTSLASIDTHTTSTSTSIAQLAGALIATNAAASGTDLGLFAQFLRDDVLTTLGVADGDATPARVDSMGALWVQLAGALSDATDSLKSVAGIPNGATEGNWVFSTTSAAAAGAAATVIDPTSGKRLAITDITISTYGTTAGRIILYFGADADLTYTAGTDQVLEIATFTPSSTVTPGLVKAYRKPILCTTADRQLKYQCSTAVSVDITLHGYEY